MRSETVNYIFFATTYPMTAPMAKATATWPLVMFSYFLKR